MLRTKLFTVATLIIAVNPSTSFSTPRYQATLVGGVEGSIARDRAVNARLGEPVRISLVVRLRGAGRRSGIYSDAPRLILQGRRHRRRVRPLSALGPVQVQWYRVEPHPHHVDTDPPNKGNPAYSNAQLFGPSHGKWLGYDRIEYTETVIKSAKGGTLKLRRVRPTHTKVNVHGGLGTMRYKAVLLDPSGVPLAATGGMERRNRGGISPRVLRVTFRSDDTFPGYLRGLFNVPNVFGSAGSDRSHQAELYQGADCADVIVAAVREAGARIGYSSVLGLKRHASAVSDKLLLRPDGIFAIGSGKALRKVVLEFGRDVRSGDLMLIDYVGFNGSPRAWDHIAVVDRDQGKRGQFDPQDPVMHMGYLYGLTEVAARTEGPAIIQFLRFKPYIQRAFKRNQRRLRGRR